MNSIYRQYERLAPPGVRRLLSPVVSSPETLRQLAYYVAIGSIVTCIDFGLLALLLHAGVYRPLSVSIAFLASAITQFVLNKYWNFRNFDRSIAAQAGTYIAIAAIFWIATVVWIEVGVRVFGVPPLVAKALFIPITVVGGFLLTRNVAFGKGIRATIADRFRR